MVVVVVVVSVAVVVAAASASTAATDGVVVAGMVSSADDSIPSSVTGGTGTHSTDSSDVGKCGDEVEDDIVVVSATIGLDEQAGMTSATGLR